MDGSRKKGYFPKEKEGKKLNIREDGTLSGGALDAKTGKVSGLVDFDPEDVVSAAYAEKLENENLIKNEKIKNLERQNARKQAQINKYQNSEQTQLRNQVYLKERKRYEEDKAKRELGDYVKRGLFDFALTLVYEHRYEIWDGVSNTFRKVRNGITAFFTSNDELYVNKTIREEQQKIEEKKNEETKDEEKDNQQDNEEKAANIARILEEELIQFYEQQDSHETV